MIQHPQFGNPVEAGQSIAEVNTAELSKFFDELFSEDPRFAGVVSSKLEIKGNAVEISLIVAMTDTDVNLPISVQIPM